MEDLECRGQYTLFPLWPASFRLGPALGWAKLALDVGFGFGDPVGRRQWAFGAAAGLDRSEAYGLFHGFQPVFQHGAPVWHVPALRGNIGKRVLGRGSAGKR